MTALWACIGLPSICRLLKGSLPLLLVSCLLMSSSALYAFDELYVRFRVRLGVYQEYAKLHLSNNVARKH